MSTTTPNAAALYPRRDSEALGEFYLRHVSAMTAEGLRSKSDIAAQLAWRDARIAELQSALHGPDGWMANAQYLLDNCPHTVRQRPGGGPEDLLATLAATFIGMKAALAQQVPEPQPVNAQMLEALRNVWSEGVIPDGFALLQDQVCDAITAAEAAQAGSAQQVPAVPIAVVTECEACMTPDVCQLRGTCDHYAAEQLRIRRAAPLPTPEKPA